MSEVNIKIDRRDYVVLAPDGEEKRVLALAEKLSNLALKMRAGVNNVADSQVLMLAGLTLLGDLEEAETKRKAAVEAQLPTMQGAFEEAETKRQAAEAKALTLQGALDEAEANRQAAEAKALALQGAFEEAETKRKAAEAKALTLQGALDQMKNDLVSEDELLANEIANLSQKLLSAQASAPPASAPLANAPLASEPEPGSVPGAEVATDSGDRTL